MMPSLAAASEPRASASGWQHRSLTLAALTRPCRFPFAPPKTLPYNEAMSSSPHPGSTPAGPARFATTCWSVVAAAQDPDSALARDALAALCEAYWYPLYAY